MNLNDGDLTLLTYENAQPGTTVYNDDAGIGTIVRTRHLDLRGHEDRDLIYVVFDSDPTQREFVYYHDGRDYLENPPKVYKFIPSSWMWVDTHHA